MSGRLHGLAISTRLYNGKVESVMRVRLLEVGTWNCLCVSSIVGVQSADRSAGRATLTAAVLRYFFTQAVPVEHVPTLNEHAHMWRRWRRGRQGSVH